jgi:hypothetical protein
MKMRREKSRKRGRAWFPCPPATSLFLVFWYNGFMTPEEKQLLERVAADTAESLDILRGIRRSRRLGVAMKFLYWVLIIGLSIAAYFGLESYLNQLGGISGLTSGLSGVAKQTLDQNNGGF